MSNDLVELIHLTGGGQIPEFRFQDSIGSNPFWIPRWKLKEPMLFRSSDVSQYGSPVVGKLLSGIAGHSLCLGVFGMPSEEEARAGAVLHGEAGVRLWSVELTDSQDHAQMRFSLRLPRSRLAFQRTLTLRREESVVRIHERVSNLLANDQFLQWQQHVTLGPPFLSREQNSVALPGARGVTDPNGYEGHEALAKGAEFGWPNAPGIHGGVVDLRQPLQEWGTGFVAGVQIDPHRELGFVCAVRHDQAIAFGYLFSRAEFPWVTLWEENCARTTPPWNGTEQARALEFGVSPLPLGRAETVRRGSLFDTPTLVRLPARGELRASYAMFLARITPARQNIVNVVCREDAIELSGETGERAGLLQATGIRQWLSAEESTA
jgi:hypothetical protein